jgi:hypothetical protein
MNRVATFFLALGIGWAALVLVSSSNPAGAEEAGTKLSLTTEYLYEKVIGGHWLRLNVTLDDKGGKGKLEIDPNYPVYNEFGDPMGFTEIAPQFVDITLEAVKLDDPAKKRRRVYEVQGKDVKSYLSLVVSSTEAGPHRLIVHVEKRVYVFPLHDTGTADHRAMRDRAVANAAARNGVRGAASNGVRNAAVSGSPARKSSAARPAAPDCVRSAGMMLRKNAAR